MEKQSGVYFLRSTITGNIYIGSSSNLKKRRNDHFRALRKGGHINAKLNRHCRKFGVDILVFEVIEYCTNDKLIKREQYYINKYKPYFNESQNAMGGMGSHYHTNKTKAEMSVIHHDRYKNKENREYLSVMMQVSKNLPNGKLYENYKERGKANRLIQRIKDKEQKLIDISIELECLKNDPILIKRNKAIAEFHQHFSTQHHYMRGSA
jgi:group I intron endonuclease